jgi:hemolysin activation/secretion protein
MINRLYINKLDPTREYFRLFALLFAVVFLFSFLASSKAFAVNPRVPSQALPKMFRGQAGPNYYDMKKQEDVLPEILPKKSLNQQEDTGVLIIPETIIILAPRDLQNIIDIDSYKNQLIGVEQNVQQLYDLALRIEQEYNQKGYPLVRAFLPTQELEPDQATIFIKVVDGFIEKLDLSQVPSSQIFRTYRYLRTLIKKKGLQLEDIERKLLLAGSSAGLTLTSTLSPGNQEGGTVLAVQAKHKLISGGVNFDNTQSEELGRQQGQIRAVVNSAMGLGESISLFGLARPTLKGMKGTGLDVPIRAGGLAASIPLGDNGLTAGLSYMESMTRPGGDASPLGLEANMKSATGTISYPLYYSRETAVFFRGSLSWTDEIQHTNVSGEDQDLSHDRVTAIRFGTSLNKCAYGCIGVDLQFSRGLDIASRSQSEAGNGTPLSRSAAKAQFSHLVLNTNYRFSPVENYEVSLNSGGQYSFDDLLNSEQTSITGSNKLSGFTSGSISGDEAWYVRAQINRNFNLSNQISISPYVYGAAGVAYTLTPTAIENRSTAAKSIGLGMQVRGFDKYFFDKSISGRIEYSKNWATGKLEDLADVRLNKQHLLVSLAMSF